MTACQAVDRGFKSRRFRQRETSIIGPIIEVLCYACSRGYVFCRNLPGIVPSAACGNSPWAAFLPSPGQWVRAARRRAAGRRRCFARKAGTTVALDQLAKYFAYPRCPSSLRSIGTWCTAIHRSRCGRIWWACRSCALWPGTWPGFSNARKPAGARECRSRRTKAGSS
jgi:hypothetical protein